MSRASAWRHVEDQLLQFDDVEHASDQIQDLLSALRFIAKRGVSGKGQDVAYEAMRAIIESQSEWKGDESRYQTLRGLLLEIQGELDSDLMLEPLRRPDSSSAGKAERLGAIWFSAHSNTAEALHLLNEVQHEALTGLEEEAVKHALAMRENRAKESATGGKRAALLSEYHELIAECSVKPASPEQRARLVEINLELDALEEEDAAEAQAENRANEGWMTEFRARLEAIRESVDDLARAVSGGEGPRE
ncbi:MAG: hypothetical protein DHS20C21_05280 [Gemmatimonadota bacterium]|nr:MAG: hypothetical protein DHS20C21_05280 [Gemmatimonadota bacterium]